MSSSPPRTRGNPCGLPEHMWASYKESELRGSRLYDWQRALVQESSTTRSRSAILDWPPSSGKTVVSDVLTADVVRRGGRVLILGPYQSLVEEKVASLSRMVS